MYGLKSLRENPDSVPQGRLSVAQDAVLGRSRNMIQSRKGRLNITGFSAVPYGTVRAHKHPPRTKVLGYTQSSLRDYPVLEVRGWHLLTNIAILSLDRVRRSTNEAVPHG